MPKRRTEDAVHVWMAAHFIRKLPPKDQLAGFIEQQPSVRIAPPQTHATQYDDRIDPRNGMPTRLTAAGEVETFSASEDRVVFTRADLGGPADLYMVAVRGGEARRLTDANHDLLASRPRRERHVRLVGPWLHPQPRKRLALGRLKQRGGLLE